MRLRKFRSEDAAACARLHRSTIRSINSKDYSTEAIAAWSAKTSAAGFRKNMNEVHRYVAEIDKKIVGFAEYQDSGEISGMYIHKDYQRLGIAKKLYSHIETLARKNDVEEFHLTSTVNAKEFYEKMGFRVIKKTKHSHDKTVYEMKKNLVPKSS